MRPTWLSLRNKLQVSNGYGMYWDDHHKQLEIPFLPVVTFNVVVFLFATLRSVFSSHSSWQSSAVFAIVIFLLRISSCVFFFRRLWIALRRLGRLRRRRRRIRWRIRGWWRVSCYLVFLPLFRHRFQVVQPIFIIVPSLGFPRFLSSLSNCQCQPHPHYLRVIYAFLHAAYSHEQL